MIIDNSNGRLAEIKAFAKKMVLKKVSLRLFQG